MGLAIGSAVPVPADRPSLWTMVAGARTSGPPSHRGLLRWG